MAIRFTSRLTKCFRIRQSTLEGYAKGSRLSPWVCRGDHPRGGKSSALAQQDLGTLCRIGFAGVGKYSEFENLRKPGSAYAELKGYAYSREDVFSNRWRMHIPK